MSVSDGRLVPTLRVVAKSSIGTRHLLLVVVYANT